MSEAKRLTDEEWAALPWLHIYAQPCQHFDAHITGTREGMLALRDAIDRCLATGERAEAELITADGEGYPAVVEIASYEKLGDMPLPYGEEYARG